MIFPMIQPTLSEIDTDLPLYKEVDWDFENNIPVFKNGSPSIVSGQRAVLIWAWKALHVQRTRYEIYTWDYGNEIESLTGQPFTSDLKRSEAIRYVKETLLVNPYITDVTDIVVNYAGETISITCKISTVYGEVSISV